MEFFKNWYLFGKQSEEKKEDKKATEVNILPFSYDLATLLRRRTPGPAIEFTWNVIEKGAVKTNLLHRRDFSTDTVRLARLLIKAHLYREEFFETSFSIKEDFLIYLKGHNLMSVNNVKTRGVIYALLQLTNEQKRKGVVAISTGSFAVLLCYYGHKLQIPVTVVMPKSASIYNVDMCRYLSLAAGVNKEIEDSALYRRDHNVENSKFLITVTVAGNSMMEAHNIALNLAKEEGLLYLDGNDHPDMIIGQATFGLEIMEELCDIDAVILPTMIDGCAFTASIAKIIKDKNPSVKVIEVQSDILDPFVEDVRACTHSRGELEMDVSEYVWCSMFYPTGIPNCWIDKFVTVDNKWITAASKIVNEKLLRIEHYAIIGLAAILSGKLDELKGKRVLIPLYGKLDGTRELTRKVDNDDMNEKSSDEESSRKESLDYAGSSTLLKTL